MFILFKTDNGEDIGIDVDSIVTIEECEKNTSLINLTDDRVVSVLGSVPENVEYIHKKLSEHYES